jgi:hypothetical protein
MAVKAAGYHVDLQTAEELDEKLSKLGISIPTDDKEAIENENMCFGEVRYGKACVSVLALLDIRGRFDTTPHWWMDLLCGPSDWTLLDSVDRILIACGARALWGRTGCNRLFIFQPNGRDILNSISALAHVRVHCQETVPTPEAHTHSCELRRIHFEVEGIGILLHMGPAMDVDRGSMVSFLALEYGSWIPWRKKRLESIVNRVGCALVELGGKELDIRLPEKWAKDIERNRRHRTFPHPS